MRPVPMAPSAKVHTGPNTTMTFRDAFGFDGASRRPAAPMQASVPYRRSQAKDIGCPFSGSKSPGPFGFAGEFGLCSRDQGSGALRRQRHQAVIIADHQIAGGDTNSADHDRQVDRTPIGAAWAAWIDPAGIHSEVVPAGQGSGIAHRSVTDHACNTLGAQMA